MTERMALSYSAPLALVCSVLCCSPVHGHAGRRFEVRVENGRLMAQGVNTGAADGQDSVRPYENVIHDHWRNSPLIGVDAASAILPEFDVAPPPGALRDRPLTLSLLSVTKWQDPPPMPAAGTIPQFVPLSPGEVVSLSIGGAKIDSLTHGSLLLTPSVPAAGLADIPTLYEINRTPTSAIYALGFMLSSPGSTLRDSAPAYVLLSPMGSLHHATLYLENYLGTQVPEPTSLASGAALLAALALRLSAKRLIARGCKGC